jgi:hypothetical protein
VTVVSRSNAVEAQRRLERDLPLLLLLLPVLVHESDERVDGMP